MKDQNFKNHTQIVWSYYLTTGVPIIVLIVIAVKGVLNESEREWGWILLLIGWILLSMLFRSRGFALKAQDRAIRAEESLRYFVLTGKPIDRRITLSQIIALRFASDDELPSLTERAVTEGLSNKEIKRLIKTWRADWHRV